MIIFFAISPSHNHTLSCIYPDSAVFLLFVFAKKVFLIKTRTLLYRTPNVKNQLKLSEKDSPFHCNLLWWKTFFVLKYKPVKNHLLQSVVSTQLNLRDVGYGGSHPLQHAPELGVECKLLRPTPRLLDIEVHNEQSGPGSLLQSPVNTQCPCRTERCCHLFYSVLQWLNWWTDGLLEFPNQAQGDRPGNNVRLPRFNISTIFHTSLLPRAGQMHWCCKNMRAAKFLKNNSQTSTDSWNPTATLREWGNNNPSRQNKNDTFNYFQCVKLLS